MKTLKFAGQLPKLILQCTKTVTWRINDDKNIVEGDILSLCTSDSEEFAQAVVTKIGMRTLGTLTAEDKEGHEVFSSEQEMYDTYSRYYYMPVTKETQVKVIHLKLI